MLSLPLVGQNAAYVQIIILPHSLEQEVNNTPNVSGEDIYDIETVLAKFLCLAISFTLGKLLLNFSAKLSELLRAETFVQFGCGGKTATCWIANIIPAAFLGFPYKSDSDEFYTFLKFF